MNEQVKSNIVQAVKYLEEVETHPGTSQRNLDVALSILLETLELWSIIIMKAKNASKKIIIATKEDQEDRWKITTEWWVILYY